MARHQSDHPEIPFLPYRSRQGNLVLWAKQMPEPFGIQVRKGLVDQRKAGAKARVQYVQRLEGNAGDYLVITDSDTGARNVFRRKAFEKHFALIDDESGGELHSTL